MGVQLEDKENTLLDEAKVDTEHYLQKQSKEGVMSRGIKRKVVQLYQTSRKNSEHVRGDWGRLEP